MEKLTKSKRLNYLLGQMGIFTPEEVVNHLPRRYENLNYTEERNLEDKQRVVVLGKQTTSGGSRKTSKRSTTCESKKSPTNYF